MNRTRYLALMTRMLDAYEVGLATTGARVIDASVRAAGAALVRDGRSAALAALDGEAAAWHRALVAHLARVSMPFARVAQDTTFRRALKAAPPRIKPFSQRIAERVREVALVKAKALAATTKERVAAVIARGERDGLPLREIADQITSRAITTARARTIARTETHGAATWAMQATIDDEPDRETVTREWVAALDERTRESHADADGQTVGIDEPFVVGGVELMVPGDQDADAPEETISCRCVVLYSAPDLAEVLRGR